MTHKEIREKFFKFFEERDHKIVPSSSLISDDQSVLFTSAGMQQFKSYYIGNADAMHDFGSLNTITIQKCVRTSDIDEVGDESHLTFFEMMGNFSFGGYWKKEAIQYGYDFITKEMGLEIDYVSIFEGDDNTPVDKESEKIWREIDPNIEIRKAGKKENFWGPTGAEGPCGPTTEIYVDGVEIWNIVFNEFYCQKDGTYKDLKTKGIDTGMGLERLAMAVQKKENVFETDLLEELMLFLPNDMLNKTQRILADHIRASIFIIGDGVIPSNKEQGYILRKLLRRVMVHSYLHLHINADSNFNYEDTYKKATENYKSIYPNLEFEIIENIIRNEYTRFNKTLDSGLKELTKIDILDDNKAFYLYQTYGLPFEVIKELDEEKSKNLTRENFDKELEKHQEISRAGVEKKFGGHGLMLDTGEVKTGSEEDIQKATRLHTATHLLHYALRKIFGNEVHQQGSDINPERLRFDFNFSRKLEDGEKEKIEKIVNELIQKDLKVIYEEMSYEDAVKSGALAFFRQKYPEMVKVYSIVDKDGEIISKELCGGPHVDGTGELGKFRIKKEQSVGVGVRRIKAVLEKEE